jgi:hypothetical protein
MTRFLLLAASAILLASCIQKEALNAEADIIECIVDGNILKREPIIQNDKITLLAKGNTDLAGQSPDFTLTRGATIEPAGGTARDFTSPQTYVVTSEDRRWQKAYSVSFIKDELSTVYHFEDTILETNKRFYIFAEKNNGSVTMEWASGNSGFALTASGKGPDEYPTTQSDDGYAGKCARLVTRSTGPFGAMVGMPIAAGNLFIGTFNVGMALSNPLKATCFGLPFYNVPTSFSGYYKYKAGEVYYDKTNIMEDVTDACQFYAVLYETDDDVSILDGTNILTHPNVISAAVFENRTETDEWIRFDLPFTYRPGKRVEPDKLEDGKYNLAVVFTSSIEGGLFRGAPGSTLHIDEVEISFESESVSD